MSENVAAEDRPPGWSLQGAIDALADAASQAGRPSSLWLAGLMYPAWSVASWRLSAAQSFPFGGYSSLLQLLQRESHEVTTSLAFLPLLLIAQRLSAGLARISHPGDWERARGPGGSQPRLSAAWRAGYGSTLSAVGLWILLWGMLMAVSLALGASGGGLVHSAGGPWPVMVLLLPAITFLLVYAALLMVLHQLALHSLVQNRRGVGSALVHAWRIARHDPGATSRAFLAELVLMVSIGAIGLAIGLIQASGVSTLLGLALLGFAGTARAAYWARAYRALGGLVPGSRVPGLSPEPAGAPAP